jgi:hypothetical protein
VVNRNTEGKPFDAIIRPQSAGARSRYVPIGLSARMTCNSAPTFWVEITFIDKWVPQ